MSRHEATRIGKRGTLVIPASLRRVFGLEEGSDVIVEETPQGILIRPAVTIPLDLYAAERRADLLVANAVDDEDRRIAREAAGKLGVDASNLGVGDSAHLPYDPRSS